MGFIGYVMLIIITMVIVAWRWVEGIDYMKKNHPNYKGMDLFGEDEDEWDNKSHTEGKF
jgi:hypothetical protein